MITNGNDKALEAYKIFPYIAWAVTIGFSMFVYSITTDLIEVTTELQIQTKILQEQVSTPVEKIVDFEA